MHQKHTNLKIIEDLMRTDEIYELEDVFLQKIISLIKQ